MRKKAPTTARRRGGGGVTVLRQGFAKHTRRRRGVGEGRGCALSCGVLQPTLHPSIYRGRGKGGRPSKENPRGGRRPRGGGVHPPQGTSEVPSPFRTLPFPYLLVHGPLGAGDLGPYRPRRTPYSPCGPPGQVAPPGGPPGPFRWSWYNTGHPKTCIDGRNSTSYI